MNNRLQELAAEAELYVDLYGRPWPRAMSAEEADAAYKKFAQLIIKECAGVSENHKGMNDKYFIADAIRQHFGVEE